VNAPIIPDALDTRGTGGENLDVIGNAMNRISQHDPARLNAVAHAVTDVLGFTVFSRRYAIAVLVLEALGTSQVVRPEET
jgi:hypothetical protein